MSMVEDFAHEFRDVCQVWREKFSEKLVPTGQSITRGRALLYLNEREEVTQKELACLLNIEEPSVVRMVDGLEKSGLVMRVVVNRDKRHKHVKLTEAAKPLIAEINLLVRAACDEALEGISEEKLRVAREVFALMTANILRGASLMDDSLMAQLRPGESLSQR